MSQRKTPPNALSTATSSFSIWQYYSAGYTTAHFTQLNKCSQNSTFGRQFVTLSAVRHAVHLTLIQFRDRASLVHRETCIFIESSTSVSDDDDVTTLSRLHDLQ